MKYYINSDLESVWHRIEKSTYVNGQDTMLSWLRIMESGQMYKVTQDIFEQIENAENATESEKLDDEKVFYRDLRDEHFRVPILIKDSKGDMVVLYGNTHLELMMKEEGSCRIWVMTRERWKE